MPKSLVYQGFPGFASHVKCSFSHVKCSFSHVEYSYCHVKCSFLRGLGLPLYRLEYKM